MSGYIGSTPVPQATQHRESFTATAGQTSFATAGYTPQFVDVYLNGVHLSPADVTATNGSDVVLVACLVNDIVDVVSYSPFEVAGATFTGTTAVDVATVGGTLGVAGVVTANAGVVVDEMTLDADTLTATDDFIIDAVGEIHLDADNSGVVRLKDGGTEFGTVFVSSSNLNVKVQGAANDILFSGNNAANNAAVTFLTLDGGEGGRSTFASDMVIGAIAHGSFNFSDSNPLLIGPVGNNNAGVSVRNNNSHEAFFQMNANNIAYFGAGSDTHMVLRTNNTDRIKISDGGRVSIGTFSGPAQLFVDATGDFATIAVRVNADGDTCFNVQRADGTGVGNILANANSTSYVTSSDYRLKENVDYSWDATTRLKQLKPARFNFISDDTNTLVDGFLAHEAQTVVPESVSGTHNETETLTKVVLSSSSVVIAVSIEQSDWVAGKSTTTDSDGNTVAAIYPSDSTWAAEHVAPKMQGIDQAKLVPLLVKTILELEARITALEG